MSEPREVQFRMVCMCCPHVIVEGDVGAPISHGLCDACFLTELEKVDRLNAAKRSVA